jgi:hypothetical protein
MRLILTERTKIGSFVYQESLEEARVLRQTASGVIVCKRGRAKARANRARLDQQLEMWLCPLS